MKVGDLVRINNRDKTLFIESKGKIIESEGKIGLILRMVQRKYVSAAIVLVMGEICEWYLDELEVISESR